MPFRPDAILLTTAEAAALLEITPTRVRQLVAGGHIEKKGKDRITLDAAVKGYNRFMRDEGRRTSKSASASRVQDARAREIELRTAERDGRLIDIVEHRDIVAEVIGTLRSGFAGLPAQVTRDLTIRSIMEAAINDAFARAADGFEQATANLADGGAASAAIEAADA